MEIHFPAPTAEQEISRDTLLEKYAKDGEQSVAQVRRRVARALAQIEREADRAQWERRFLQAQEEGFIPAGRINSAAGVNLQATLINCFVQPVGDSISEVVEGRPGIYTALQEAPLPLGAVGFALDLGEGARHAAAHLGDALLAVLGVFLEQGVPADFLLSGRRGEMNFHGTERLYSRGRDRKGPGETGGIAKN